MSGRKALPTDTNVSLRLEGAQRANAEIAGEQIVALDRRRGCRRTVDPNELQMKAVIAEEKKRNKTQRRRQIDPTTCERDYSGDEVEFMQAMDVYKRKNGRMFPTCSEILEVIRDLGYVRELTHAAPIVSSDTAVESSDF